MSLGKAQQEPLAWVEVQVVVLEEVASNPLVVLAAAVEEGCSLQPLQTGCLGRLELANRSCRGLGGSAALEALVVAARSLGTRHHLLRQPCR